MGKKIWESLMKKLIMESLLAIPHAYRIYNKRLMTVEESVHVVFNEVDHKSIQVSKNST